MYLPCKVGGKQIPPILLHKASPKIFARVTQQNARALLFEIIQIVLLLAIFYTLSYFVFRSSKCSRRVGHDNWHYSVHLLLIPHLTSN